VKKIVEKSFGSAIIAAILLATRVEARVSYQVQHWICLRKASAGVLYPRHFCGVELMAATKSLTSFLAQSLRGLDSQTKCNTCTCRSNYGKTLLTPHRRGTVAALLTPRSGRWHDRVELTKASAERFFDCRSRLDGKRRGLCARTPFNRRRQAVLAVGIKHRSLLCPGQRHIT
jgi:hypothetical protein